MLKNYKTLSTLSSEVVSAIGANKWIESAMYPGLWVLTGGMPIVPNALFKDDALLIKGLIDPTSAEFGSIVESGLTEGQWDYILDETSLIKLVASDKGRWTLTSIANVYSYNNADAVALPKVPAKPVKLVQNGKVLTDAFAKLTVINIGGVDYPAMDLANPIVDGEFVWAMDPTETFMTIYTFAATDPDAFVDGYIRYDNGTVGKSVYLSSVSDVNSALISKPGGDVSIVPTVAAGKRVLVMGIVLYNSDDIQQSKVRLELASGAVSVPFYQELLQPTKSYFIDSPIVCNEGDSIKVYSDNKLVTAIVSYDEA